MNKKYCCTVILAAVSLCCLLPAHAGVIVLKNGEEITGTITRKTRSHVSIVANGELNVFRYDDIAAIKGNKPRAAAHADRTKARSDLEEGLRLAAAGSFLHAEELFKSITEESIDNTNAAQALAAIEDLRTGIIDTDFALSLFQGAYYSWQGKFQKAVYAYEKALENRPDSAEVYYNLGKAYQELGRHQKAIPYFQSLLQLNADDIAATRALAQAYYSQGDYRRAVEFLEKAATMQPEEAEIFKLLGVSYRTLGDRKQSIRCFEKARELLTKYENYEDLRDTERLMLEAR